MQSMHALRRIRFEIDQSLYSRTVAQTGEQSKVMKAELDSSVRAASIARQQLLVPLVAG